MKTSLTLLRILVLVGCLPLLVRNAWVVKAGLYDEQCTNFGGRTTPNCPAGCTSGTYTTYPLVGGSGWYNATSNDQPCSPSGCPQPVAYNSPTQANCNTPPVACPT